MVSVQITEFGLTELIIVDPAAKINGQYYQDVMVTQTRLYFNKILLRHTGLLKQ